MNRRSILACMVLLGSCGPRESRPTTPAAEEKRTPEEKSTPPNKQPGVFEIRVNVARRSGEPIVAGAVVPTGSDFQIMIELDEPAHVYVGGINASNKPYLLLPAPSDPALLAPGPHRLPAKSTSWLWLKPPSGQERLFVIAARNPLATVDTVLAETVGEVPIAAAPVVALPESAAAPAVPKEPPPAARTKNEGSATRTPATRTDASRATPPRSLPTFAPDLARTVALTPRGDLVPREIDVRDYGPQTITAPDGVVVYLMPFRHVPAPGAP